MTTTVLLIGHGSRNPAGNREVEDFAKRWRERQPERRIDVCYIEFAEVLLDDGLDQAARGSERVIIVPLILNAAGHVKMEVPAHIAEARRRHPGTEFIYTPHLGACDDILRAVKRKLHKILVTLDMPDPKTTGVILLGRGASDRAANGEVAKMARWLFEDTDHELVDIAFTGITHPRLESTVKRQVRLGMSQIAVQPYYLFTGTLIERIRRQVERLRQQYPTVSFGLGEYFGFEPELFKLVEQRVNAALGEPGHGPARLECDGCKYRLVAEEHGHGHHHHH
ncbi:MAG TPA: sirohydrochlorin chelatase [Gammaproteobacteria bacterium]|nr:sirohydrochlorin chelatase [Gammaproteobacteria bacterium]